MTLFDIPRQRLRSQCLTGSTLEKPDEVVGWLGVVQAQDYLGAKWALGMRLQSGKDEDIEQAFNKGAVLRTHLMRPTWHFVTPDDIRWLLELTKRRVQAVNAGMYRKLGLEDSTFTQSHAALVKTLEGGRQLTRDELRQALQRAGIATDDSLRMIYLMMHAELEGIICSGARRGKQFTYTLLDERAPHARLLEREEAQAELARRDFKSRGPASVQDFAKWSGLTVSEAKSGLEAVETELEHETLEGQTYWFSTLGPAGQDFPSTVHLLSIYDEYISGYKDRSAVVSDENAEKLVAMDNALQYILVIAGQVLGTWRRTFRKDAVVIETNPFRRLTKDEGRAVVEASRRYGEFLGLGVVLAEGGDYKETSE